MKRSRLNLAAVTAFISLFVFVGMPASRASADPMIANVYDHNIAGLYAGALNYVQTNEGYATVVLAQEVCASTLPIFTAWTGYTVGIIQVDGSAAQCGGGKLYNVAATRAYVSGSVYGTQFSDLPAIDTDRGEYRAFVCIKAAFIFRQWMGCSAHTTGASSALLYTISQTGEYMNVARYLGASVPMLAGGDFNMTPATYPPTTNLWYWYFNEGDYYYHSGGTDRPTKGSLKIDYVFGERSKVQPLFGVADLRCGPPSTNSDHCFYRAVYKIP